MSDMIVTESKVQPPALTEIVILPVLSDGPSASTMGHCVSSGQGTNPVTLEKSSQMSLEPTIGLPLASRKITSKGVFPAGQSSAIGSNVEFSVASIAFTRLIPVNSRSR